MEPNDVDNSGDDKEGPAEDFTWVEYESITKSRDPKEDEIREK